MITALVVISVAGVAGVGLWILSTGMEMARIVKKRADPLRDWVSERGHTLRDGKLEGVHGGRAFWTDDSAAEVGRILVMDLQAPSPKKLVTSRNALGSPAYAWSYGAPLEDAARRLSGPSRAAAMQRRLIWRNDDNVGVAQALDDPLQIEVALQHLWNFSFHYASHKNSVDALASHIASDPEPTYVCARLLYLPIGSRDRFATLLEHREEPPIRAWVDAFRGDPRPARALLHDPSPETAHTAFLALVCTGELHLEALEVHPNHLRSLFSALEALALPLPVLEALVAWLQETELADHHMAQSLCHCVHHRGPEAESAALALLEIVGLEGARSLLAWLKLHGSVKGIPHIQRVVTWNPFLVRVSEGVVHTIQARASGSAGAVSLSDEDGGELSLTTGGELSEAQSPPATNANNPPTKTPPPNPSTP